jgi:hypothetical protein
MFEIENMNKDIEKYFETCSSNLIWDNFLKNSNEASVFMYSWYTEIFNLTNKKLFYIERGVVKAAILIYMKGDEIVSPAYSVYHSLCYSKIILNNITERFRILQTIIEEITNFNKAGIKFSFHHGVMDVRPLLWHNFENIKSCKFSLATRYTAVLNLDAVGEVEEYIDNIRINRKRDYIKSKKNMYLSSCGGTKDEVINLYMKTFQRQNIEVEIDSIKFIERLIDKINSENGFIFSTRTLEGEAVAITICLMDHSSAYSLIIANDSNFRNSGASTACMIGSVFHAKELGKKYFDFVGANSPFRSDFKISFNSDLKLYFEANLKGT